VDRGPWTVDRGPWSVDRGPWSVDRRAAEHGAQGRRTRRAGPQTSHLAHQSRVVSHAVSAQSLPNLSFAPENPTVVRDSRVSGHVYRFSALDYSDFFEREGVYQRKTRYPREPRMKYATRPDEGRFLWSKPLLPLARPKTVALIGFRTRRAPHPPHGSQRAVRSSLGAWTTSSYSRIWTQGLGSFVRRSCLICS